MSDIRFNQWLHQSGTGGVSQDHIGNIGIGTTNPSIVVSAANTAVLNVGVITANNLFVNNAFNGDITGNVTGNISGATGTFSGNVDIADKIIHTGDTDTAMRFPADNTFAVDTAGSERFRITSDGNLLSGTSSSLRGGQLQVASSGAGTEIQITESSDAGDGPTLRITRLRGSNLSSPAPVQADNYMGQVAFDSYDTGAYRVGAFVRAEAEQTWASGDCPTRLIMGTTSDGANSPSERLRIHSHGQLELKVPDANPALKITPSGTNAPAAIDFNTPGAGVAKLLVQGTERLRIASDGQVTFDKGAVGGANQVIARFQAESSRRLDIVWHDSGSLLGFDLPGSHSYIFKTSGTERLRITSAGTLKVGSNTLVSPNGNADNFVIDTGDVDSGLSILSATTGRIYFGDASDAAAGSIRYVHTDNSLRFEAAGGEKLRITSDGGLNNGNITISGYQNTHNPDNYSLFLSDNHANTFFGQNLRLGYSSGSGNHQLVVNKQHASIGGAGILIGGNGSNYVNEIQFINVSGNQTAGTRVDDTKRRLTIESSGRVVIHGNGTIRSSYPGAVCSVNNLAMMDAGSGFSWGLRANSGDTQWCLERIVGTNSFSDSNIKFRVYNNGNYSFAGSNSSDRDIKENIEDISGTSLNLIDQLRPRTFNFKESEGYSTEPKTGFVAQEIGAVIPSIVNGTDGQKDMGVDYNGLVAHLVKAVQELKAENDSLRSRLDTAGL